MGENIYLRKATSEDMKMLFDWANDEDVRRNSFNSNKITWEEHKVWFERLMKDENQYQYILMVDNIPAGQIRLNCVDGKAEIGYSIAPKYRGRGLGTKIIELAKEETEANIKEINMLVAKVKPENAASEKCFERCHFLNKYNYYELELTNISGGARTNRLVCGFGLSCQVMAA